MSSALGLQSLPDVFTFAEMNEDECMYDQEPTQVKMEDRSSCMQSDGSSYLDLTNHKYPTIKTEYPDDKGLLSWTQKHPEHWTKKEVLDWIYFVAETVPDIDLTRLRGEAFQDVNGQQLSSMSIGAFITRDPEFGQIFYDMFKSLSRDSSFIEPVQFQENGCSNDSFPKFPDNDMEYTDLTETTKLLDSVMVGEKELRVCVDSHWYDIDIDEVTATLEMQQPRLSEDDDCWTSESETGSVANYDIMSRLNSTGSDVFSSDEDSNPDLHSRKNKKSQSKRRNDSSASEDGKPTKSNRGRKVGQTSKGNHLWEFIRDLLKDTKFNPHLLRWEDKDSGVFRFVQSEAVAQMWGRKKNNPGMTYEKLSRAMRFCRTAGYFGDVPKNGKFPKKLCFRFGPKAFGWKEI